MSADKIPLELNLEISSQQFLSESTIKLSKVLYAGFIPQHGMEIVDTEIIFKVRTIALAGLTSARHTANPLKKGKWVEGNRRVTGKLFPKDESQFREALEYFKKQGWKIEQ